MKNAINTTQKKMTICFFKIIIIIIQIKKSFEKF